MTTCTKEFRELENLYDLSFPDFASDNLKIQTIEGDLVPFEENEIQRFIELIIADIRQQRLVRLIILKARREGVSTYFSGRFYWKTSRKFNHYTMVITHEPEATDFIFNMTKRFQAHNPFKPSEKYNSKKELEFNNKQGTGLDSAIRVGTAGKEDLGSAQLIHNLLLSEVPKWPRTTQQALLTSVLQCVPDNDETEVVFEGTAKGIGGEFYTRFWGARYQYELFLTKDGTVDFKCTINENADKDNIYSSIFIPWFVFQKYEMDVPTDFQRTKEEELLATLHNLTDKKLQWRRYTIANKCNSKDASTLYTDPKDIFKQEYPSTAVEAFLASGKSIFEVQKVLQRKKLAPPPKTRYECLLTTGQFIYDKEGRFKVWQEPIINGNYIVSADVAEGIETGDFDSADVIDQLTGKQVAQWHGHIDPDQFAKLLFWIGKRYNGAWLIPERNNHGFMVCDKLVDMGYPHIYMETIIEPPHKPRKRYGWVTSGRGKKAKPLVIDNLVAEFRDGVDGIMCAESFNEMLTFKQNEKGELGAEIGYFDDRVMSIAIGKYVRNRLPRINLAPAKTSNLTPGSASSGTPSAQAWT